MSDSGGVAEQEPDPHSNGDPNHIRHMAAVRDLANLGFEHDGWSIGELVNEVLEVADAVDPVRAELRAVRADLLTTRQQLAAVNQQAESLGGPVGQMVKFAAKHGQLQRDLKCEDCSAGDHYHCAHGQSSYPRCCCPERLDLNQ